MTPPRKLARHVEHADQKEQKQEDIFAQAAQTSRNREGKQLRSVFVVERIGDERVVEGRCEEDLVQPRVDGIEIAVLLLVHHHEAVVLSEDMIVAPELGPELEPVPQMEQDQDGADGEEEREAGPQPAPASLALPGIEVGARDGGKTMRLVEYHSPHRDQQQQGHIGHAPQCPERIGRRCATQGEPEEIGALRDNPTRLHARLDIGCGGRHRLSFPHPIAFYSRVARSRALAFEQRLARRRSTIKTSDPSQSFLLSTEMLGFARPVGASAAPVARLSFSTRRESLFIRAQFH